MDEEANLRGATDLLRQLFGEEIGLVGTVVVLAVVHPEGEEGDRVLTFFDGSEVAAVGLVTTFQEALVRHLLELED